MQLEDAIYRELTYGLCGTGGSLESLVEPGEVQQDMRTDPPDGTDASYPQLIFRIINDSGDNQVNYDSARVEFEVIGIRSSATAGEERLVAVREALLAHFRNRHLTIGKFQADGTPDPSGGLRVRSVWLTTVPGFDETYREKAYILAFRFHRLRS